MATFKTTIRTSQDDRATSLHKNPSLRDYQQSVHYAEISYDLAGTEANTDVIELICLQLEGARIIPELSRVINVGAGDADLDVTLNGVTEDGATTTALTTAASVDNNAVVFGRLADGTRPVLAGDDVVVATLSNVTAATAAEELIFVLAYSLEDYA